jgi:mono/diheme cytochrome c family protein
MKKLGVAAAIVLIVIVAAFVVVKRIPESPFAALPAAAERTPTARAEYVARLADCVACHSIPEGQPFAGGLKMGTPLGVIYSTNITPDRDTGIGSYTLAEFDNAVRRGVARDGRRLYPAMPYPSYAKLTDEDVKALYDYFMHDVRAVSQLNQRNELQSPLDMRWPLALWNVVFFRDGVYETKPSSGAIWNRGAYLVQGPGHCGSCHTPRGVAFQEKALDEDDAAYLSGALLDGWYASSLRGDARTGLGAWAEQDIVELLKTGHNVHATVFGSMMDAFNNSTQFMTDDDLTAIARYLKSLPGRRAETPFVYDEKTATALNSGDLGAAGAGTYLKQCSFCHAIDGRGHGKLLPPLAGNPTLLDSEPASVINIILNGAGRIVAGGVPDSYRMPPYRVLLSDAEIADVATFIRSSWGNGAKAVTAKEVAELRGSTDSTSDHVIVLKMR